MKRSGSVVGLMVLAVITAALFGSVGDAKAASLGQPITRVLPAKKTVSGAYVDSALFTIPAHTTSSLHDTLLIDTSDWDWTGAQNAGPSTTAYAVAFVNFNVFGTGAVASGIDSLHCQYQTSMNGTNWSKVGNCSLLTWNNNDVYGRFPILADNDALNSDSFFGQKYIRIIVNGDTGGKLGQVQASVTYWPLGDVRVTNNPDASFR